MKKIYLYILIDLFFIQKVVLAQNIIIPDQTLPNLSIVVQENNLTTINGGTRSGKNLFHSFEALNINSGNTLLFNNDLEIGNIITRVTGNNKSIIDGLLKSKGNSNLFLINSNGIFFGSNSRLDIGGSFLGTTANSINFTDGEYNTLPSSGNVLSDSNPIKLVFSNKSNSININGIGSNILQSPISIPSLSRLDYSSGLSVRPNHTLAIIGGDIVLDGGILTAPSGRIELGSVENGIVKINFDNIGITFDYVDSNFLKTINLRNNSLIDVSGVSTNFTNGGYIRVKGNDINLATGSYLLSQNYSSMEAGAIQLDSDNLKLDGAPSGNRLRVGVVSESYSSGKGGNIIFNTTNLNLLNAPLIATDTLRTGKGGNILINAKSANLEGITNNQRLIVANGISTFTYGSGIGGNIIFNGGNLTLDKNITFSTSSFGSTTGGNVTINTESLNIRGGSTLGSFGLLNGDAGDVLINSKIIQVTGESFDTFAPSVINSATFGSGDAGSLTIFSNAVNVLDGGRIDTSTLASGKAGDLTINSTDYINISGQGVYTKAQSKIDSSAPIVSAVLQNRLSLPKVPLGKAGSLTIKTKNLIIKNNGNISVQNDGLNDAGNLFINTNTIDLKNGSITASTNGGNGGDINISTNAIILRESLLSLSAKKNGNGGNLFINSNLLAGDYKSLIQANSENGSGGKININSKSIIFADTNITATSQLGSNYDGIVQINATRFSINPQLISSILPIHSLSPISCNLYASKKITVQNEEMPFQSSEPLDVVINEVEPLFYRDLKTNQRIPFPKQMVSWINNGDGTIHAVSLDDVKSNNASYLASSCS